MGTSLAALGLEFDPCASIVAAILSQVMNDFAAAVMTKHIPHREEEPPRTERTPVGPS